MDSCVCEKAVTTTQLAHRGVDLYKILGGKWETCRPPQPELSGHPHVKQNISLLEKIMLFLLIAIFRLNFFMDVIFRAITIEIPCVFYEIISFFQHFNFSVKIKYTVFPQK